MILSLCLVWCTCPACAGVHRVALIHSFEPDYPAAGKVMELLHKELRSIGLDYDIREYYLDCDRYEEAAETSA